MWRRACLVFFCSLILGLVMWSPWSLPLLTGVGDPPIGSTAQRVSRRDHWPETRFSRIAPDINSASIHSDVTWSAGGVLGPPQSAAELALDRALQDEVLALGRDALRALTRNPSLSSSDGSGGASSEATSASEAALDATELARGRRALSRLFTGLLARVAATPFASTDCSTIPMPSAVAQCLCAAVLSMRGHESDRFEAILFENNELNKNTIHNIMPPRFSVFRDVAAFRPTQCAHVATCMQWASGRLSGPPLPADDEGPLGMAAAVAAETRAVRAHFGASLGDAASVARLLALRRDTITAAGPKDSAPLLPWHPTCPRGSDRESTNDGMDAITFDPREERLATRRLATGQGGRGPDAAAAVDVPLPMIGTVRTLHILRLAGLRRAVVLHPSGGRLPGIVAMSGDSVLRGVFYSLVATLRGNTAGDNHLQPQHAWNAGVAFHSKILYVRFEGCCDVLLTNIRNAADGKDAAKAPPVSDAALHAALDTFMASLPNKKAPQSDQRSATLAGLIALLRSGGGGDGKAFVPLRWTLQALRAACAASRRLCPDLLLAFEFDHKAESTPLSFMSTASAELLLRLSAGTAEATSGGDRNDTTARKPLLLSVPTSERPIDDVVPVAVHLHSVGVWMHDAAGVLNRVAARAFAGDANASVTNPILLQRISPMHKHHRGRDRRLHAAFSARVSALQREGRVARGGSAAVKATTAGPATSSPPRWWPSLVRSLSIRGETVPAFVSGVTAADSRLLLPEVMNQPLPAEAAVTLRLAPILRQLTSAKGKHASPYEAEERTIRRGAARLSGQLTVYARGGLERMDVEAWAQLRLLLALSALHQSKMGNSLGTQQVTAAKSISSKRPSAHDHCLDKADAHLIRSALPQAVTSDDAWSRDPGDSSHTGPEGTKQWRAVLKHFKRLFQLDGPPSKEAPDGGSSSPKRDDGGGLLGTAAKKNTLSNLYVFDAGLIQTLHSFDGNDILHTDCHCAAPVGGDKTFGDRVPPSLVPQLEHAHAALFTSLRASDRIGVASRGVRRIKGSALSPDDGCWLPLMHMHAPIRCANTSETSAAHGIVEAPATAAAMERPASSSTALSLFFQTEHRQEFLSSAPGCAGWVAAEAMRLHTQSGPAHSLAVRCGVLMSQSLTGCRNPLAEAELTVFLGHLAEEVNARGDSRS